MLAYEVIILSSMRLKNAALLGLVVKEPKAPAPSPSRLGKDFDDVTEPRP